MSEELATDNLFRAISPELAHMGVREQEDAAKTPILTGYFARFDEWTEINSHFEGRFMERIAPGAFAGSFERSTPKALFQHGRDPELGDKVLGGPVTVREDEEGAAYEVPLFPSVPPLLLDGLRAGAYGASFRFSVPDDGQEVNRKPARSEHNPEGLPERTITSAQVHEFGPVTFPAYSGATAGIRSLTDEFRPVDFDHEVARMAREHPSDLARVIERALHDPEAPKETPPEPAPQPRFRSREEYLAWMSQT